MQAMSGSHRGCWASSSSGRSGIIWARRRPSVGLNIRTTLACLSTIHGPISSTACGRLARCRPILIRSIRTTSRSLCVILLLLLLLLSGLCASRLLLVFFLLRQRLLLPTLLLLLPLPLFTTTSWLLHRPASPCCSSSVPWPLRRCIRNRRPTPLPAVSLQPLLRPCPCRRRRRRRRRRCRCRRRILSLLLRGLLRCRPPTVPYPVSLPVTLRIRPSRPNPNVNCNNRNNNSRSNI